MAETPESSFTLRNLPLAARVLLAAFLITVGVGYVSALVQLHVQHASPGSALPTPEDVERAYHGLHDVSTLERLITADETLPFNGSGSMRAAFTTRSPWIRAIREKADAIVEREKPNLKDEEKVKARDMKRAEKELRQDRELEIDSMVEWIRAGGKLDNYTKFVLSDKLAKRFPEEVSTIGTEGEFERNDKQQIEVNIQTIMTNRCCRCHSEGKGGPAGEIYLDRFDVVQDYMIVEHGGGMSLRKLAQSTHVHLLGFGMLYGLTGLIFSLTSYPMLLRLLLAPFPLIMQVIDISFWWLARLPDAQYGPQFAHAIPITGGLVAVGLVIHIVFGTFNLFGTKGRLVLIVLFGVGAALAGMLLSTVVQPYLVNELLSGPAAP